MSALAIKFEVYKNGELLKEETLSQNVIKVGRMASSHLQIDDEGVSRMHAVIEVSDAGEVHIIDLGSAEGTLIDGKKVNKAPINNGDTIVLGGVEVRISFLEAGQSDQVPATAPAVAPAASPPEAPPAPAVAPAAPPPEAPPAPAVAQQQAAPPVAAPPAPAAAPIPPMPAPGMVPAAVQGQGVNIPQGAATPAPVAVDFHALEDVTKEATEVVTIWNGSVLQVNHYKADEKKLENFYIGEDPTCDFPIPAESLGGGTKVPLVINQLGGAATVTILPSSQGDVTYEDGSRVALEDLVSSGQVQASSEVQGGYSLGLKAKSRVKMDFGPWTFLVNSVPNPKKFVAPLELDWQSQIYTGISLILQSLFLFLIYFIPPDPEGLSLDLLDDSNRFIKYMLSPPEVQQDEVPEWLKKDKEDEEQGGKGKRHKGEEGQMGKRDAKKTDNHYGIKGPKDNPDPHMARSMAKEMAKNAGILSYLSSANAPTSPFGQDAALGIDPENALGALMGNQVGANFGYGGLGLRGTGRGGGGTGEGTIGLGNLNTIGHGGGGGSGSGYGRGAGGLGGRRGRAPRIRSGAAMVKGSLSKEVIRRIVHRHINEVKFCYERQLAKRPDISGRVSVKFIISGTGAVQMAAVAGSTLGDPQVENCIAQAVRRWTFPQPEGGGIVIVTYPFMLTSPEG
ncbi:MAG: AgmX/PglI C-terminal domain-containing protein [Proteobacteria bacterium]|nr:AgmX/PglI C-terminal domain-containing protein [Pseudomonadota bacterium]